MAYVRDNFLERRKHAVEVTKMYYEPGRHDRCLKWVWRKYIKDLFHIEYRTYLAWMRAEGFREGLMLSNP